jgi:RNA polymerase sigma-70 factor, ECF subfamily
MVTRLQSTGPGSESGAAEVRALPRAQAGDETLVLALIERRPTAVAELFDRYDVLVRRVLARILGSVDVDDASQETFLVVLRRVDTLRDPTALRSFVIGAAIRVAMNERRRRRLRRFVGLDDESPLGLTAPHDAVAAEQVRAVYRVLDRLDATSRALFVMRRVERLELRELAEALQCSLSTLKRRLARAEQRFAAIAEREPALRTFDLGGGS